MSAMWYDRVMNLKTTQSVDEATQCPNDNPNQPGQGYKKDLTAMSQDGVNAGSGSFTFVRVGF